MPETFGCAFDWSRVDRAVGPYLRPGGPSLVRTALDVCNLAKDNCIVDIGCGVGGTSRVLEESGFQNIVGVDFSEALLEKARDSLKRTSLVQSDALAIPLKDNSFHALFCECVLSILNDRMSALSEFARVLRTDGWLIISDVFAPEDSGGNMPSSLWGRNETVGRLTESGFSIIFWKEYKRAVKEFAARMILAGEQLPTPWCCSASAAPGKKVIPGYFLLVARRSAQPAPTCEIRTAIRRGADVRKSVPG